MSRALALVGLAVILMVGVPAIQSAEDSSQQAHTIENETWTSDPGNVTVLDHSNIENADYDDTVDVWDENGTQMTAGSDYRWFDSNGTVKALSGGDLDGDSSATITYGYNRSSDSQQMVADNATTLAGLAGYFPYVLMIAMILGAATLFRGGA